MKLLTTVLNRLKISEFINTEEGRRAFENAQRDIVTLYPAISYLEQDDTNSTNTFKDSLLKVAVETGRIYTLEAVLTFQSANTSNGIGIALKVPPSVDFTFDWHHNTASSVKGGGYCNASGSVSADTSTVPAANSNIPLIGKGIIKAGASGDVVLQFRSESTDTVTLKGGLCVLRLMQVV